MDSSLFEKIPSIYDAAYSSDRWRRALDQFSDVTDATGLTMYAVTAGQELSYQVSASNSLYIGLEEKFIEYNERFVEKYDSHGMICLVASKPFQAVFDTEIWPLEELIGREDIEFVREAVGVFRRFTINLSTHPYLYSGVNVQFPEEFSTIPQGNVEIATFLARHLSKALEIHRFHAPLRAKYKAVLSVLDKIDLGVCIATPTGTQILVNSKASEILDSKDGVWLAKDKTLMCSDPLKTEELRLAITKASGTAIGQDNTASTNVAIDRLSSTEPLLAITTPLRDADKELDGQFHGCIVTLVDPNRASHANVEAFCRIYKVTQAEAEVAKYMVQGHTTNEIADIRNVSPATVATQVQQILSKTFCKSRVELIWKVFQYSPPIF